jgi:3-isopropylmalate/(R)-2-methylmalate dehydratase large subunit
MASLRAGVSAKDLILHIIGVIGVGGGTGHVIEYRGEAIRALSMDARMTVCNMSIEAGARAGMIAPDDHHLRLPRRHAARPQGRRLPTRRRILANARAQRCGRRVRPRRGDRCRRSRSRRSPGVRIPGMVSAVDRNPAVAAQPDEAKALAYMGLRAGEAMLGQPVDVVFVGSCTNARLSDLREVARVLRGRKRRIRACACWWCRVRTGAIKRRPKPKASTRSCAPPVPNGASRAARCASP